MNIRDVCDADAVAVAEIYNHYILHSAATFEERVLETAEFRRRIADIDALGLPWLVAEGADGLLGYAYANRWRERSAYRYSVETTVYLAPVHSGSGVGTALYRALFSRLRRGGLHAAIGGITLPNPASVALHEKMGMRQVAHFPEVGFKQGRWLDVGYWQICFEAENYGDA